MPGQPKFTLVFAPAVVRHLAVIERKDHSLIRKTIREQLSHVPEKITRNRKPLEPPTPFGATWELRFGTGNRFRVFYEVDVEAQTVSVLAVGTKQGNRLFIGGEEFEQ